MNRRTVLALVATGMLVTACSRDSASPAAQPVASGNGYHYGALAFKPCSLAAPGGSGGALEAQCATMQVPEDRSKPDGRKIELHIAWLQPSNEADALPDPLVMIAGGPGQSALQSFPMFMPALKDARKLRSILLIDQRGTGKSNPLNCKDEREDRLDAAPEAAAALTRACIETLSAKADLRHYTTTEAVADLDAVRQALGIDQLNLYGVSYGTRVAQQYAMRHPQHTRTITLDSPVPNTLGLGNIFARNLDDALAAQFAVCKASPSCAKAMGDPQAELRALLARLRTSPVQVAYRDASTGEEKTGTLTADHVAGLVRMYAYMPAAAGLLPQQIREASQGRYDRLMTLAMMLQGELEDGMAMGMQMSVICTEDAGSFNVNAGDADTVLGTRMTESMAEMCAAWPAGTKPADFNAPLKGDVPALVLSGEYDPVTPPRYAEEIAKGLPNARWFNLKGQGHGVLTAGCMPKLFAQFLEKADATSLDAACLDTLPPLLPFTSFNGWEP